MMTQGGPMEFNYLQRVKVYRLNDDGKWDDKGTGHVSVEYLERSDAVGLVVIDEDDNATLLVHRISADDIYQRQEDTIISWTDPEVATDLALSFQETMGCAYIWDQICSVQRQIQFPSVSSLEAGPRHLSDDLEHSGTSQDDDDVLHDGGNGDVMDLPPADLNSLPQIIKIVTDVSPFHRDRVAAMLLRDQNYVTKILELCRVCEDLENLEGLHYLYRIVRGLILLNDGHLFDLIFSDEWIMDIIGALEYDPEVQERQQHRKYLKDQVIFKEAVPIRDPVVLSKIHQTYRIGYIKDVILPRVLDDQTAGTLNSLMLFNNLEVVNGLHMDRAFMTELFSRLMRGNPSVASWKDLVLFLQEFCNLHKHLPPAQRNQFFGDLISSGLFEIVTTTLQHPDEQVRRSGIDILMATLNPDPAALRTFLVEQTEHKLFSLLIKGMLAPGEGGLQVQLLEMLRLLLDSDTMEGADKNKFLDVFYEKYVDQLVGALTAGCPQQPQKAGAGLDQQQSVSSILPEVLGNLCELLCFCVQHHSFRIKYFVLRNNVVEKVLRLTRRKEKNLVVAAVRFLRTCIGLKDEFYFRYLVKNNLLEPVIQVFLANGSRYNLLNSAVIELVDFIRKENVKSLIAHLVEKYGAQLEKIEYVDTFKQLQLKYDQAKEGPAAASDSPAPAAGPGQAKETGAVRMRMVGPTVRRKEERVLDREEEDYFNGDSDEQADTASAPLPSSANQKSPQPPPAVVANGVSVLNDAPFRKVPFGLVDYEDEDDDVPPTSESNGTLLTVPGVKQQGAVPLAAEGSPPGKRRTSAPEDPKKRGTTSPGKRQRVETAQGPEEGARLEAQPDPEVGSRGRGGAREGAGELNPEEGDWFDRGFEWRVGGRGGGNGRGGRGGQKPVDKVGLMGKRKLGSGGGPVRLYVSSKDLDHGSRRSVPDRDCQERNDRKQEWISKNGAKPGWAGVERAGAVGGSPPSDRAADLSRCSAFGSPLEGQAVAPAVRDAQALEKVGPMTALDLPAGCVSEPALKGRAGEAGAGTGSGVHGAEAGAGQAGKGPTGNAAESGRQRGHVREDKATHADPSGGGHLTDQRGNIDQAVRQVHGGGPQAVDRRTGAALGSNQEQGFLHAEMHSSTHMNFHSGGGDHASVDGMSVGPNGGNSAAGGLLSQDPSLGGHGTEDGPSIGSLGAEVLCAASPPEPFPVR